MPCRSIHYLGPSITASTWWPTPSTMLGEQACGCQAQTWPTLQRTPPLMASTRRSRWILMVTSKPITSSWTLTKQGANCSRPIWWISHPEGLALLGGPSIFQEDPLRRLIPAAGLIQLMSAQGVRGFDQASAYIHLSVNVGLYGCVFALISNTIKLPVVIPRCGGDLYHSGVCCHPHSGCRRDRNKSLRQVHQQLCIFILMLSHQV